MVLVQGVMIPSWACNMAPALGRKALEFMIINLVSHYETEFMSSLEGYQLRYQLHRFKGLSVCVPLKEYRWIHCTEGIKKRSFKNVGKCSNLRRCFSVFIMMKER